MHGPEPSASHRLPEPEAGHLMRLAGGAVGLLRVLRVLRRAHDDGTISAKQYEGAVKAIESEPDEPRDP